VNPFVLAQSAAAGSAVPELMPSVGRVLFALVVVLGLLGGLAWVLKRNMGLRRGSGSLAIETALALGERRSLVVVTIEGRRLLLGLAPNNVSLVTELGAASSFDAAVSKAVGKGGPQ
jgi:flagellar protein FliO/FliZ